MDTMIHQSGSALENDESPAISGLFYIANFIDEQPAKNLISIIDQQPWISDLRRRVQHYGYRYDYKARNVSAASKLGEIPDWLQAYCKLMYIRGIFKTPPDQVIINEYQPGQGIAKHTDCIPCFGDTVASLSLGSTCIMDFTQHSSKQAYSCFLEEKSMVVLTGDARYKWQHGIASRKADQYHGEKFLRKRRISLTFRNVLIQ